MARMKRRVAVHMGLDDVVSRQACGHRADYASAWLVVFAKHVVDQRHGQLREQTPSRFLFDLDVRPPLSVCEDQYNGLGLTMHFIFVLANTLRVPIVLCEREHSFDKRLYSYRAQIS